MKRYHILMIVGLASLAMTLAMVVPVGRAGQLDAAEYAPLVVRAYYQDEAMVRQLATWKEPWAVNRDEWYVVLGVTPAEYDRLAAEGWYLEIDVETTIELSRPRQPLPGQGGGIPGYACYRTVEETFASAEEMAADYPELATWIDIGDSWEKTQNPNAGYDMMVLRLTNEAITGTKPALLVFGAIHAREYTTAETATRFAEYLLQNYGVDADATWLLDYHEVHLVLQTNPDGRKVAETGVYWRKNTDDDDGCVTYPNYGVDLNRNFQFQWGCCGGSSGNACAETYRGPSAGSEPETAAVQDYAFDIFPDQRPPDLITPAPITSTGVFIDLHAYAEEILWSWGFTSTPAPNAAGLQTLARKWGYFNGYDATQSLYPTDGSTKDFAYGEFGVPGYTIEMGTAFFQSCSYFESTVWPDNLQVLIYAAKAAGAPYITPSGPDSVAVTLSADGQPAGVPVTVTAEINDTRYNNSQGAEPTQPIAAAEYYLDVPPWGEGAVAQAMTAADGNFNSTIEDVIGVIDTSGLTIGKHILFVRGQDTAGNWGAISAVYLNVSDPAVAPLAGFTSSSPDDLGETTVFTNTSTGTDLSYEWEFGDGSPVVTETNPSHTYTAAGVYTVTLTASNVLGSDSYAATVEIIAPPPPPPPTYYLFLPVAIHRPEGS